jgi:ATP/maltotriose-dependent transcriptional regulator MalT/DNA-binding SARP family transcriptional activator
VRVGGAAVLLGRPRLVERLLASRVAVLEAPGGYGKSTLCAELVAALDRPAVRVRCDEATDLVRLVALVERAARRSGLAALVEGWDATGDDAGAGGLVGRLAGWPSPLTVLFDDVHRADPAVLSWIAAVVDRTPERVAVVVAGRRVGRELASLARNGEASGVGPDELCFTRAEITDYLAAVLDRPVTTHEAATVERLTGGWPAAVAVAAGRLVRGPLPSGAPGVSVLADLVDGLLASAPPETARLVGKLGHLNLISAESAAAVGGPGSLDQLLDIGIPVRFRPDGWGELAAPVRELLQARAPLELAEARAVASLYARRGEPAEALLLLRRLGDDRGLVEVLAGLHWSELGSVGVPVVAALLDTMPDDVLRDHTEVLVAATWAGEVHAPSLRRSFVRRADALAPPAGPVRRLVDVELGREHGRRGDLDGEIALTTAVLRDAATSEVLVRARAHLGRGRATMVKTNVTLIGPVRADLEAAAALFRFVGEHRWESQALLVLGYGLEQHTGALVAARDRVVEALSLLAAADASRGMTLTYVAECYGQLGEIDAAEQAVHEAGEIARRLRNDDLSAYVAWQRADVALLRRDRDVMAESLAEAERHPGTWFDGYAGLEYLAHVAEMWLKLGEPARALDHLERAEARPTPDDELAYAPAARARYEASLGDPVRALEVLGRLEVIGNPRDRWLWHLLAAVALQRSGDAVAATGRLALSRLAAQALGDPDRIERREPELLALLGSAPEPVAEPPRLRLLGGFELTGDGTGTPPPGRAATLVKVLALRRMLTVDEAVDLLWSDADLATGRARLRNLLERVRRSSGPIVERRGDALAIADDVDIDTVRFDRLAAEALASPPERRAGLARQALVAYRGELLPADRYEDWAAAPRERLQRSHLALVELVTADAEARGDLDEALRLLDVAMEAEPLDTSRHVRAARALLRQGRPTAAGDLVRRAVAQERDLGVPVSPDLQALAAEIG